MDILQVERAVAVHLYPLNAATSPSNHPCLPSKACKLTTALGAFRPPLPCMPSLSCRSTKPSFIDAPISQAGMFGDTVEGFAQQFSVVQKQTEAIQHILPRHDAPPFTVAPRARPQFLPRTESTPRPTPACQPAPKWSRKTTNRPTQRCGNLDLLRRWRGQRHSFPGGGPGRESLFHFVSVMVTTFSKKEQFPFPPGSQAHGLTVCDTLPPHSRPRLFLPAA